jgi:hypothetical protein
LLYLIPISLNNLMKNDPPIYATQWNCSISCTALYCIVLYCAVLYCCVRDWTVFYIFYTHCFDAFPFSLPVIFLHRIVPTSIIPLYKKVLMHIIPSSTLCPPALFFQVDS